MTLRDAQGGLPQADDRDFEAIFEQAAVGIVKMALDGRFLRVNRKLCDILGYSPAEMLQLSFRDITIEDDLATSVDRVRGLLAGEYGSFLLEKRYRHKEGHVVWGQVAASQVCGPDGSPDYMIAVVEDISARKAVEATLREREHRLDAIVGHSPSALSLKHPDGRYALANPNLQRMLGLSEAEIIGRTDTDLYPEEVARAFQANDRLVLATLARHSIEEVVPVAGAPRTYLSHMFPVLDDAGRAEYVCRISLDITERKRADGELRRRVEELERLDRASTGRELKMIELKREVNALLAELGREPRYDLSFAEALQDKAP